MKKTLSLLFKKHLGFFIFLFFGYLASAQDDASNHPKPFMWATDNPQFKQNFIDRKWERLNKYNHVIQPTSFRLRNFLGMLLYFKNHYGDDFQCLHVYIAAYTKSKKLTLIFAPSKSYPETDLGYFTIPENKPFDENQIQYGHFKIKQATQKTWRDNFESKLIKSLVGSYDAADPDNQMADKKPSDTRCITYCRKDLLELVEEQGFDHTDAQNRKINFSKDMRVSFAAFGDDGHPVTHKGKKRLFVEFDFLDEDTGDPIYLETTGGFNQRMPPNPTCNYCLPHSVKETIKSLDNGTLCPPCDNCPAGYTNCTDKHK